MLSRSAKRTRRLEQRQLARTTLPGRHPEHTLGWTWSVVGEGVRKGPCRGTSSSSTSLPRCRVSAGTHDTQCAEGSHPRGPTIFDDEFQFLFLTSVAEKTIVRLLRREVLPGDDLTIVYQLLADPSKLPSAAWRQQELSIQQHQHQRVRLREISDAFNKVQRQHQHSDQHIFQRGWQHGRQHAFSSQHISTGSATTAG